ncbi:unnamed protein product, partial [Rotaria sp. Silwood1]
MRPSSPAVTQAEHAESSLSPITILYESSIVSTSETVSMEVQAYNKNNIGLFVNKDNLSTAEMYALLTEPCTPPN